MGRRRYLSTDISTDPRVGQLAAKDGYFAALLYTWMIPHAADDASLPADPEQLLLRVVPNMMLRAGAAVADVEQAVSGMLALGLVTQDGDALHFPESFYRHQTYIKGERRGSPQPGPDAPSSGPTTEKAEEQRVSARISADQRTTPQNVASSSFSSPVSFSSSAPDGAVAAEAAVPDPVKTVWSRYREKIHPAARLCPGSKILTRLKTFSVEDLLQGIDRFSAHAWEMEHNARRGGEWFFGSDARVERWLYLEPEKERPPLQFVREIPRPGGEVRMLS